MISLQQSIYKTNKGPVRRSLFGNGSCSLFLKTKDREIADICLYFLVGSQDEKKNFGIVHLLEHLLFKEPPNQVLISQLEAQGAALNAYTYKEYVCFEMSCLAEDVSHLLPLFLQLILRPHFDKISFAKEKKVVLQEILDDQDDHEVIGFEKVFEKCFKPSLGHPIAGSLSSVKKITFEDVNSFYQQYFKPNKMILSLASGKHYKNLEHDFINIQKSLGLSQKSQRPFRLKLKKNTTPISLNKSKMQRRVENALYFTYFNGPTLYGKDYYEFVILDFIMTQGMTSLFFKQLREVNPLVYNYSSALNSFCKQGNYIQIFNCHLDNLTALKKEVHQIYKQLGENIDQNVLLTIQKQILKAWKMDLDDVSFLNELMAAREIYSADDIDFESQKERLMSVDLKSLRKVINKYFTVGHGELYILPKN